MHQFGNPAGITELKKVADKHHLKLVFDAAHGAGASYQGEPVGKQGDAQIFSLSPTKLLITGEGGIVATNNDDLAEMIRMGREYGNDGNYDSAFAGLNANTVFYNTMLGFAMLFSRYWLVIPALAIAGSLALKKKVPASAGTLETHTPLFILWLIAVVVIFGALSFLPALALGPVVEHLLLY